MACNVSQIELSVYYWLNKEFLVAAFFVVLLLEVYSLHTKYCAGNKYKMNIHSYYFENMNTGLEIFIFLV